MGCIGEGVHWETGCLEGDVKGSKDLKDVQLIAFASDVHLSIYGIGCVTK